MSVQKISCIYIIKSFVNKERFYVGSTIDFIKRENNHRRDLKINKHASKQLQRHVNKYGFEDIYFEILEFVKDKNNLLAREQYYLDTLNPYFNTCKIAGSTLGKITSESTKLKLRLINLGKKQSDETIKKRIQTGLITGSIAKMRQKKLGTTLSSEHKENISKALLGIKRDFKKRAPMSEETKIKIGAANKIKRIGIKLSEEHKRKIGLSQKGKKMSTEAIQKRQLSRYKNIQNVY